MSLPIVYCMMTQNRLLETKHCVDLVGPYVDEVVVVDGGSTDDSVFYLRNRDDVNMFIHPWEDNFPKQRTNYIKRAREVVGHDDFWCYDEETQILTEDGFKFFYDLNGDEKVLTYNTDTGELEYQLPTHYHEKYYSGDMVVLDSKCVNFSVTPNHRMYISPNANKKQPYVFLEASELSGYKKARIRNSGEWLGTDPEFNIVDGIDNIVLMKLLGWYIAEGWSYSQEFRHKIQISQVKPHYRDEIFELVRSINRSPIEERGKHSDVITFYHKPLFDFLQAFGKTAWEKKIIPDIKRLPKDLLRHLLESYLKGDGSYGRTFTTTSSLLADDIQEVCLKLGKRCTLKKNPSRTGGFNSKDIRIEGRRPIYVGSISDNVETHFQCSDMKTEKYQGKVYCVTVPNSVVCVRRNNRVMLCGNCLVSDPDEWFSREALTSLYSIQDEAERRSCNLAMFRCTSVTLKGDRRVWENVDEYWKGLFFRYKPGLHYIGNPHETLVYPNEQLRPMRTELMYEHVKQEKVIWHRGCRNMYIGGGGPNLGARNPKWVELKQLVGELYGEDLSWHDFEKEMLKGKLPDALIDWLLMARLEKDYDGASEMRESYKLYFRVYHPEEEPEELRDEYIQ